jgi:hypothetical protein
MTARGRSVSVSLADGGGAQVPLLQPDQIVFVAAIPDELTSWERRVVADKELAVVWVDDVKGRAREAAWRRSAATKTESIDSSCISTSMSSTSPISLQRISPQAAAQNVEPE